MKSDVSRCLDLDAETAPAPQLKQWLQKLQGSEAFGAENSTDLPIKRHVLGQIYIIFRSILGRLMS